MKVHLEKLTVQTRREMEMINITDKVEQVVARSGIKQGLVNVITMHTTTGITVNEGLPCLEEDTLETLKRLVPEGLNYHHARYLDFDGRVGVNAHCHLRGMLTGINALFPVENGRIVKGGRQTIYFVEMDGPLSREYCVQVLGE